MEISSNEAIAELNQLASGIELRTDPTKLALEQGIKAIKHNTWIAIADQLPECSMESEEDPDEEGFPQWHGMVSASLEISDGYHLARGHYRDDGSWVIYGAEHDFQMVKPEEITHYKALPALPDRRHP